MLIDPFFTGNPSFKGEVADATAGVTHILVTHGHGDHVGDTVEIAKATGAKVVTNYDLAMWLASQGVKKFDPMNTGGTTDQGEFTVTLVRADHSASLSGVVGAARQSPTASSSRRRASRCCGTWATPTSSPTWG